MFYFIFLFVGFDWISYSDAAQTQFDAQAAQPYFANSSQITESIEGNVNLLPSLLTLHHAVFVLLYSHKIARSKYAATAFDETSRKFQSFGEIGWLAVNCAHNCGAQIKHEFLPQVHFYQNEKNTTTPNFFIFTGDISDSSSLSSFVSSILHPINFISSKSELIQHREKSSPYSSAAELFIKPSKELLNSDKLLEKANKEARKLSVLSGIKTNFLLYEQNEGKSTGIMNSHFQIQFQTDFPVNSIRNFPRKFNSIIRYSESGFNPWKNNNIWKSFPSQLFKTGKLLLFLETKINPMPFDELNEEIKNLAECKTQQFSLSKDCFATQVPPDDFNYKRPDACEVFSVNFWTPDIKICCFKDFDFDENVLCNRVFNGTFGALSLPESYLIVFERLGFPDDHSQPLLIDFLSEEAVQKLSDETLFDFLEKNLKKTSFSNSPGLFMQQFQSVNSSNIGLAKIQKSENEYFGEYLDDLLWNNEQNMILVLTSKSCGYCDIAKRAALNAKFYLETRISLSVMTSLSFNILEVDSIHLPTWLNFKNYPQVLLLPAKSRSGADSKILTDKISKSSIIKFIVTNVNEKLRILLALELKGGSSEDAIISTWNVQQKKINALESLIKKEKYESFKLKRHWRENQKLIEELERDKKVQERRLKESKELIKKFFRELQSIETIRKPVNETFLVA
ncbi:unnamed protein product [Oikopleura dioica]|uniref:Thioredoxin domain-containing protein n=2 Tax=Oikopleura dioica TaxID=34765 RepID=E4XKH9_OIKDI|nr:unnamed protein product [Oikopleura dioica]